MRGHPWTLTTTLKLIPPRPCPLCCEHPAEVTHVCRGLKGTSTSTPLPGQSFTATTADAPSPSRETTEP